MRMKKILLVVATLASVLANAQTDTVSIMYYNLLDYPSGGSDRVDTLEKIIRYVEPDLFLVNELESNYGANLILSSAMNTQGVTHYSKATFYNGPDTDNMLFYNNEKFGLLSQNQISTVTRDISEYKVYYKEPGLNASSDTTYLWLYSCHLKAGSFQSDIDDRQSEATSFKNYLQTAGRTGNMFIGGDFNFYDSSEPGCQMIVNGGSVPFNDPVNSLGSWHNNSFYTPFHTQCTRVNQGYGGGSSGGMDDRFDFIFITDPVKNGTDHVQYLNNSYKAIGQDANHFNMDVNAGFNSAVPADIARALFYNSDHLPVYMEMVVDYPVGVQEVQNAVTGYRFLNENELQLMLEQNVAVEMVQVYNLSGQIVLTDIDKDANVNVGTLSTGVYVLKVNTNQGSATVKFVKN